MKKLIFSFVVIFAITISGCKKDADVAKPSSSNPGLKHSEQPIPFKGSFTGIIKTAEINTCGEGWTTRHFEGTGHATHMGNIQGIFDYCMKLTWPLPTPGIDGMFNGPGVIIGANGDQLEGFFVGTFVIEFDMTTTPPTPVKGYIETDAILHHGTGNLAGAHGFIHGTGVLDYSAGPNIPTTLNFDGTIQYGSEFFQASTNGEQNYVGSCGSGSNGYEYTGPLANSTLPMPGECSMEYCATTLFAPHPPYPANLAIGGTNTGTGTITDGNGDEINSAFTGLYRFTYLPSLQSPQYMLTDGIEVGLMTGGTGVYEGATGTFVGTAVQTIMLGPGGAIFPCASSYYVIGFVHKQEPV